MSGGVVYRAKRRGVIYAALVSPLVAATVAATLVLACAALAALVSGGLIERLQTWDWGKHPIYLMALGVFAVIYASLFTM